MSSRILTLIVLTVALILSLAGAQELPANQDQNSVLRGQFINQLKYGESDEGVDTTFQYIKSPGRAFLFSAVVPGTGQLYAGAKWRALIYAGIEAAGWGLWYGSKSRGLRLEGDFEDYADTHWNIQEWANNLWNTMSGPSGYHSKNFGSHHIYVEYNEQEYMAQADTLNKYVPGWVSLMASGSDDITPIKTRDFYENIGKYDQFAGGWDDFGVKNNGTEPDTLYMNDYRNDYLTQRKESNDALKMATNFVTVLMFNHLISAFDANIAAKKFKGETQVSWHLGLITDYRQRNPLRGVSLNLAF